MAYPPEPPLLLTRRLSSFLHASLESLQEHKDQQPAGATLQTALLVTPSGKLLAYESPLPVRTLRTHCSVAASLWTIHASSSPSVAVALGQAAPVSRAPTTALSSPSLSPARSEGEAASPAEGGQEEEPYHDGSAPVSIAASFNGGAVFVVCRLRCGLLFACSTPSPASSTSRPPTAAGQPTILSASASASAVPASTSSHSYLPAQSTPPILPPPSSSASATCPAPALPTPMNVPPQSAPDTVANPAPGASVRTTAKTENYETAPLSASHGADADRDANADAAFTTTTGTATTISGSGKNGSVAATLAIARRQVDELARLLNEKLGSLSVPEDNIGINGFC